MDNKITITICGDGGCGKSAITLRIVRGQWTHEYDPTIEDSYSVTRTIDGTTYHLALTDTAGQEEYRSMWSASSMNSDAFLLVYDITSPRSLEQCEDFDQHIQIEHATRVEGGKCWPVRMLVGNKCDLASSREVSAKQGLDWARARGYGFMETSARDMVNIEETLTAIVKRVVQARTMHAKGERPDEGNVGGVTQMDTMAEDKERSRASSPHLYQRPNRKKEDKLRPYKDWWASVKCF